MATACVAFPLGDVREVDHPLQKTHRQWTTCLDDVARRFEEATAGTWTRTTKRCASASNGCCPAKQTSRSIEVVSPSHRKAFALVAELLLSIARLPRPHEDDSLLNDGDPSALPSHLDSECLAKARIELAASAPAKSEAKETKPREIELLRDPTMEDSVNLGDFTGIQTRGKAAKKAAKKAQQAKWMDSDNEDGAKNGEGGNDGEGGGGNDGGGGGGGGGNGDGGAGGDDGDEWDFGGKKNKKNKKKAKQEEEEKRAREEEEERKKREEAAAAHTLSWADETNDANVDDEWAAFSSKKEKKKKGKKVGEETTIAAPDPPTGAFHEISLDDGAPKLDFSFGGPESKKDTKMGGLGGWGKSWDFGSIGNAPSGDKAAEAEKDKDGKDTSTDFGDNNPWSFGNKNKTKKKTTLTGGFDFGGFGVSQDTPDIDLGLNGGTDANPAEESSWGFPTVNKKDKKKKGKDIAEEDTSTARLETDKEKEAGDSWGMWGTGKKDKKKGAKGAAEDPVPEKKADAPAAEPASTFDWSLPTSKKDKNKKMGLVNEVENDPIVAIEDAATGDVTATGNDDWMNSAWTTGNKKDKKGKRGVGGESSDPPESMTAVDTNNTTCTTVNGDDEWGFSTTKSRKDKKGKKADAKASDFPPVPPPPPPAPEPVQEDDDWGTLGKKDKKSGKKTKVASSEPAVQDPEPSTKPAEETKEDTTWGSWGLSSKDKKKKDKDAKKKDVAEPVSQAPAKAAEKEEAAAEDDTWGSWGMAGKKKSGKKGRDEPPPPAPTPPAQGLTPEPGPAAMPEWEDDGWAELTSTKTKNNAKKGAPSRSTTLTGTTSKLDDAKAKSKDAKDEKGEAIASIKDDKASSKKDATKEETPAKTAKSMWGSFGGTTTMTAKAKLAKEKEKRDEEKAKEAALAEAFLEPGEGAKPSSKAKAAGKSSKPEAKSSGKTDDKKADEAALIDILDEPLPNEEKASSKLKNLKSDAKASADKKNKESEKEGKKPDDYFGFWGTSKKTTGKKDAETKREINIQGSPNENDALAGFPNGLEGPVADEPTPTTKLSKTMSTSATKSKNTVSSSVSARIKALEANKKEEKADKSRVEPQFAKDSSAPEPTAASSPKGEKKKDPLAKSKTASASTPKSIRKKDLSPPAPEKKSKETVPGSFPGAFGDDDDLMALDDFPAAPEKKPGKKAKDDKKATAKSKIVKMEDLLVEAPEPPKLPTPPPEEKKPVKKERARVERTGAASWGFWGAAPTPKKESTKKEATRSVEEEEVSPAPQKKGAAPGLSRSKSTKTPKEKEQDDKRDAEKASKSSGSDTKDKRSEARASKPSRGMGLSSFMMGGPPPSATRTKPTRQSSVGGSRSASRRQSVDIDAGGLMSPPPDEQAQISNKAAKLMGVRGGKVDRTKSVKGKERASIVPDPYPIDDDDMVMVNGLEDPLLNGASSKNPPKAKMSSKTKSNRVVGKTSNSIFPSLLRPSWEPEFIKEVQADGKVFYQQSKSSKPRARTLSNEEDVVMVEAGPSAGEPFITSGPDDMAFVEHSAPGLKRSNTATKKPGGFFGGLFGGGSKAEKAPEPGVRSRPTSSYRDDRMIDAEAQPTRAKEKSKRRSMKPHQMDVEGPDQIDTNPAAEARGGGRLTAREAEEAERAERRKSRREKERAELEARRSKARDRARKEQEAEEQRREEKRARRAVREEARLKEEADVEAAAAARREERRRLRAELEASQLEKARVAAVGQEGVDKIRNSAKEDRKKQFEREEEERLRRREEKKSKPKDKSSGGKRKSTTSPLMEDYFESRNGTPKQPGGPPDKTSSWVKSQASDPPDLPPVEGTILDGEKPRSAGFFGDEERGEERRRSSKKNPSSRRHSKYVDAEPEDRDRDRRSSRRKDSRRTAAVQDREESGVKPASGSGGERDRDADRTPKHRSRRREVNEEYDAYADGGPVAATAAAGIRTFDGRPANTKRNSILGRLGGFL